MPSADLRLRHLKAMVLGRVLDERMLALYSAAQVPGNVFTGRGQEAFSAAGGVNLRPGDVFAPCIRDQAGRVAFNELPIDVARTYLTRVTGPMRGRDGNVHRGCVADGILPMISHLGAMLSVTAGTLLARKVRGALVAADGSLSVGMASIGDGGMNTGATHEALNLAGVERLPFVLMLANNQVSYSTFNERTFACDHLVDRAIGYGFRGVSVDGTDPQACLAAMTDAVARARAGEGPQMVVASLLRLAGHGSHDDASYVPAELKARFRDCIDVAKEQALRDGLFDAAGWDQLWADTRATVQAAIDQARGEPTPDPAVEDWSARSQSDLTSFMPTGVGA
jgi:pyruvate dehydrogenase E1 component alpha subunit/2-oxoisovalerate dehydrogenase E1 component alpha subunit